MTDPNPRHPDHPVDDQFIARHSPRAFTDEELPVEALMTMLEAARWAPSGSNLQPTRMVFARRGEAEFTALAGVLAGSNRVWAEKAAALVLVASKAVVERDGVEQPHPSHAFDAGAAWMSLALQAHLSGWHAHAMGGFDKPAALALVGLAQNHQAHVVVAIGRKAAPETLPEAMRAREQPNQRHPLSALARHLEP